MPISFERAAPITPSAWYNVQVCGARGRCTAPRGPLDGGPPPTPLRCELGQGVRFGRAVVQVEVDADVAECCAALVVPTDRASMLLGLQRQRVRELEDYTAAQIDLLQGLTSPS